MTKPGKAGKSGSARAPSAQTALSTDRELVVVAKRELRLRATREGIASATGADVGALNALLASEGASMVPLFGVSEERLRTQAASLAATTGADVPDLSVYYHVDAPDERLDDMAEKLLRLPEVEAAYVKPPAEPADFGMNDMAPREEAPPVVTPDFTTRQGYLGAAATGIDARYAWTVPGGRGTGVNIIDIEWGWRFDHEDLRENQGGVVSGTSSSDANHGTAVLGEYSGDRNAFGVTGISPEARAMAVSLVTHSTSQAIRIAADRSRPGDIILLEVHRAGPRSGAGSGQFGYIAIEWWPDDFDAIRYAVSKGVIVVEAAGNGGQNLDDSIYDSRPAGFPTTWRNPFNPANPSSGAVVVGAGMPPTGTHGRTRHPGWGDVYADRGRCFFSNFGARVDAQGWGWEVTSTGYGDLQGGPDPDAHYTDQFSGTSSAGPIVVGALACVQGALRAAGRAPLSPGRAIELLRGTGSPQQDAPGFTFLPNMTGSGYPQNHPPRPRTQRIGNRPNLRQLIARALDTPSLRLINLEITQSGSGRRYSGVFRQGTGGHALWVNATWDSFVGKWQELSAQGLRLIDLEITLVGDQRRYSGAFLQGTGGHALWVNASWESFVQKWQELSAQGLRLIDLEITQAGDQRRYSGVFRQGSGAHALWVNATWDSFVQKWQELSAQGLRLIDLDITLSGTQRRYSGVFRQGTGGHALWANASWESFVSTWQDLSAQGLRLIDLEITQVNDQRRYSGVFRQGTGGHALWVGATWESFVQKWQELSTQGAPALESMEAEAPGRPGTVADVQAEGPGGFGMAFLADYAEEPGT